MTKPFISASFKMTKPFISASFNHIELKILDLYRIYNSDSLNIDKDRLLRLIHTFESDLNKLNDMYFDLSGDIDKYLDYYKNSLNFNDCEND